jgi:hypothetical protein
VYCPPQMPSLPSGLGTRVPVGPAGRDVVVGAGVGVVRGGVVMAAGLSLTQYAAPGERVQVDRVGFSCTNWDTVREFAPDTEAHVSPALAITVRVHGAAKTGLRQTQAARSKPGYRD